MIRLESVSLTYPETRTPALREVNLTIPEGELALVVGRTGSGKSSLLRVINGLAPTFTGGTLRGRVTVAGRDTSQYPPRELADVVGVVLQDPREGFVTEIVEDEIAYGMESLGLTPEVMRRRVEESLDLLGLSDIRSRPLRSLSGGQQQRAAIASVLAQHPSVLVLDEPTSALDPGAAEEVLAAIQRLVHDLGLTVVMAEHRLERVVQFADRIIHVHSGGTITDGSPSQVMVDAPVAPPVVELGRWAQWSPLPLSVRDARRLAAPLRETLSGLHAQLPTARPRPSEAPNGSQQSAAALSRVRVQYGAKVVLNEIELSVEPGEIVALMGRNGAGKSTLLRSLVGLNEPAAGTVRVAGREPAKLSGRALTGTVGMVPQEPGDLLWTESVRQECSETSDPDQAARLFDELAPNVDPDTHPRDLSEGQRLSLALAVVLAEGAPLLLLDEPTRGLDYGAKGRLVSCLRDLAADGRAVLLATHDVELAAEVADRVALLAEGEIVAEGPASDVLSGSPAFAPQVAKVMHPQP
ncbi:MAG TPA: ATP-binding cassette domain-containing protein, partial [Actinomycetes bacterium]|nr:ATP-binding cassette domain-containing protein [Actinomycetes bacterium]